MTEQNSYPTTAGRSSPLVTAVNILTAPRDAFAALQQHPSKLFPLLLILGSTLLVMLWYFSIVDFDWYIDDTVAGNSNLTDEQQEAMREGMRSMSQNTFTAIGVAGGVVSLLLMYVVQSGYLSMASALNGDRYRFSHWFSLICWANLPALLGILGMVVTILMSPNGQISVYALNPLTLANLGVVPGNGSLQSLMNVLSLPLFWTVGLIVMAYHQWVESTWSKALAIVLAPYILIFGVWTYFALN